MFLPKTVFSQLASPWWRHGMGTALLTLYEGNPPVTGGLSSQKRVMGSFAVFFSFSPNALLDRLSSCRYFEIPWLSCDFTIMKYLYFENAHRIFNKVGFAIFFQIIKHFKYETDVCLGVLFLITTNASIAYCKTAITPLLTHWSCDSLALSHRHHPFGTHRTSVWKVSISVGSNQFKHAIQQSFVLDDWIMTWSNNCSLRKWYNFRCTVVLIDITNQRQSHIISPRSNRITCLAFSKNGKLLVTGEVSMMTSSDGYIFPHYWPFVRGIHLWPVNSPHKSQWRRTLVFLRSSPEQMLSKQS